MLPDKAEYDSKDITQIILDIGDEKGLYLNVTKIQKILYIAYGYFLAEKGIRLTDEHPKAWPYGPVFPKSRKYIVKEKDNEEIKSNAAKIKKSNTSLVKDLTKIVEKYSEYTANQLSEWSHEKGGPWAVTTNQNNFEWNDEIEDYIIKGYFSNFKVL